MFISPVLFHVVVFTLHLLCVFPLASDLSSLQWTGKHFFVFFLLEEGGVLAAFFQSLSQIWQNRCTPILHQYISLHRLRNGWRFTCAIRVSKRISTRKVYFRQFYACNHSDCVLSPGCCQNIGDLHSVLCTKCILCRQTEHWSCCCSSMCCFCYIV